MHSQLVQFMLVRKGYNNHHYHKKSPDREWGWSVDEVMPRREGSENLRILKKRHRVDFLPLRHKAESSAVEACGQVLQISTDKDLKTSQDALRVGGVSIVSLSSCRHELKSRN